MVPGEIVSPDAATPCGRPSAVSLMVPLYPRRSARTRRTAAPFWGRDSRSSKSVRRKSGWSIGVMAREMGVIYEALRREQPIPLEPLAIQYADYTLWHLEWLRVRGTDAETRYWREQLAAVKPFKVIADHPRPAIPTTSGAIASPRLAPMA